VQLGCDKKRTTEKSLFAATVGPFTKGGRGGRWRPVSDEARDGRRDRGERKTKRGVKLIRLIVGEGLDGAACAEKNTLKLLDLLALKLSL